MEESTEILPDSGFHFAQIANALGIESGSADFDSTQAFWSALVNACAPSELRTHLRIEEALVWRILSRRMVCELRNGPLFQLRDKGAASGTCTAHPGVDLLAKTYERLRHIMDELSTPADSAKTTTATGLPMRMMKLLEGTEGALEAALGLGPGETSAFSPRLHRNGDPRSEDAV